MEPGNGITRDGKDCRFAPQPYRCGVGWTGDALENDGRVRAPSGDMREAATTVAFAPRAVPCGKPRVLS